MQRTILRAVGAGLAGAIAVTLIHEGARRVLLRAPRMDVLGERALARGLRAIGLRPPRGRRLHRAALAGDLVANSAYYALVAAGRPRRPWLRGLLLGGAAGLGAVLLPPVLGLGRAPRGLTRQTQALTVAWYLAGGVAAAAAARAMDSARAGAG